VSGLWRIDEGDLNPKGENSQRLFEFSLLGASHNACILCRRRITQIPPSPPKAKIMILFSGNLNRLGFLIRSFAVYIAFFIAFIESGSINYDYSWTWWKLSLFYVVIGLLVLYSLAIISRRLKDIGLGRWIALAFIPFPFFWPLLFFVPSKK